MVKTGCRPRNPSELKSSVPKVCRHHASRGLAVLLRHGLGGDGGDPRPPPTTAAAAALVRRVRPVDQGGDAGGRQSIAPRVTFGDEQRQPWRVIQTWLDLRHDLAVVALLQVRCAARV